MSRRHTEEKDISPVVKARAQAMKDYSLDSDRVHVLIAVTNHEILDDTGRKTGWYLPEVAHPYHVFSQAGFTVHFVSPKGGQAPMDPKSAEDFKDDEICKEFLADEEPMDLLLRTYSPASIDPTKYMLIFFAGGHGPMFDMHSSDAMNKLAASIYELGGIVGAVCHGPVGLINIKLESGEYLIKGKKVTCFSNEEEEAVGLTSSMPFLLEDKLKERGGMYTKSVDAFKCHVVRSERVITGQNPASSLKIAQTIVSQIQDL